MNCPVCKRELAPTLSICFACGAMVNDTVREELETKIVRPPATIQRSEIPKFEPILPWSPEPVKMESKFVIDEPKPLKIETKPALSEPKPVVIESMPVIREPKPAVIESKPILSEPKPLVLEPKPLVFESNPVVNEPKAVQSESVSEPVKPKVVTNKLRKETNPTLVGFQPANPAVPDWRLQLQNAIRKRNGEPIKVSTTPQPAIVSAPAVAQPKAPAPSPVQEFVRNEKLANAMKRIEASKRTFGSGAAIGAAVAARAKAKKPMPANRQVPFEVIESTQQPSQPRSAVLVAAAPPPKPQLVPPIRLEKKKFDTNKLPPIPEPEAPLTLDEEELPAAAETEVRTHISLDRLNFRAAIESIDAEAAQVEEFEEIDDLAPLSMRFGAAVFDLIISGFAAGLILSPVLLAGSPLSGMTEAFAIFGVAVAVLFVYFTATIGFMGRTFGMKLFSIEIIDAEANELPTLHQAAVNSAVYILSLLFLGLGFVPAFFNEERRAMHDLVAGTLLIREY
jgi:DNA-directed RNA polymerase II subunit RPB1